MADLTATLIYSNRHANIRPGMRQQYTDVWHVDGFNGSAQNIPLTTIFEQAENLPYVGMRMTGETIDLYCTDLEARSLDPMNIVEVRVTWKEDPLGLPLIVNGGVVHQQDAAWEDTGGLLPVNSAGDPYNPPLERVRAIRRFEITKRYPVLDWSNIDLTDFVDHVNNADLTLSWRDGNGDNQSLNVWPAGTAYLDDVHDPMVMEPICHYQVTFVFLVDTRQDDDGNFIGWKKRVPDAGPRYKDGTKLVPFTADSQAAQYNGVGLLDGSGGKLDVGSTDFIFNEFDVVYGSDFASLGLF
jgi:hypothetical protein